MKSPKTNPVAQKGVGSIGNSAAGVKAGTNSLKMTPGCGKIPSLSGFSYMPNDGIKKLKDSSRSDD